MDIERTREVIFQHDFIDMVCSNIAAGGSLVDLCITLDIHYPVVHYHITHNEEWNKQYIESLKHCNEWLRASILRELKALATIDIRKAYDDDGNLLPIKDIPDDVAKALASIETDEIYEGRGVHREQIGVTRTIRFYDKLSALEKLGKTIAMFTEKVEHTGALTLEQLVSQSRLP